MLGGATLYPAGDPQQPTIPQQGVNSTFLRSMLVRVNLEEPVRCGNVHEALFVDKHALPYHRSNHRSNNRNELQIQRTFWIAARSQRSPSHFIRLAGTLFFAALAIYALSMGTHECQLRQKTETACLTSWCSFDGEPKIERTTTTSGVNGAWSDVLVRKLPGHSQ